MSSSRNRNSGFTAATGISSNKAPALRVVNPDATKTVDGNLNNTAKDQAGDSDNTIWWVLGIAALGVLFVKSRAS